jgi:hypothetical protein
MRVKNEARKTSNGACIVEEIFLERRTATIVRRFEGGG